MASVGLIVEGSYDEAVLSELVRKCASSGATVICRTCGNAIQLMKKFPAFLEEFRHAKNGLPIDRAIVIRDADHKNPDELITRMEARISGRIYPFPRKLLVIVQELEAWLLADEEALLTVIGKPQQRIRDPETVYDPKARLERILSDARITYTAEVARKIAAAARPDILAVRCPSFGKFQEAVSG
jgi:hypothetical protein